LPSTLEQVHQEFNQKGLTVLAVNVQENRSRVAKWVKEKNVTSLVLLDADGAVARLYGVTGTPTVLLIGRQGELIGRAVGSRAWTGEKGHGLFEALLSPQAR
jgi:cytochrome c biogenesis protein CcmG/thiol:disulfide interchange protein DsbE